MERTRHYVEEDKQTFLRILEAHKHIIENKKTDAVTNKEKNEVWLVITDKYNATNPHSGQRNREQLKMLYKNLKRKAREDIAQDRVEAFKTSCSTCALKATESINMELDIKDEPLHYDSEYVDATSEADMSEETAAVNCSIPSKKRRCNNDILELGNKRPDRISSQEGINDILHEAALGKTVAEKRKINKEMEVLYLETANKLKMGRILDLQIQQEEIKLKLLQLEFRNKNSK